MPVSETLESSEVPEFSPSTGEISLEDALFKPEVIVFVYQKALIRTFHTSFDYTMPFVNSQH